jgi:hypothetical protein
MPFILNIADECDLIDLSYYCLEGDFQLKNSPDDIIKEFNTTINKFGPNKNISLSEFGVPSNSKNKSSQDKQWAVIYKMLDFFRGNSRLLSIIYFSFVDMSYDDAERYAKSQGIVNQNFLAFITSTGMVDYSTGSDKTSWTELKKWFGKNYPENNDNGLATLVVLLLLMFMCCCCCCFICWCIIGIIGILIGIIVAKKKVNYKIV